jgi:hypothetical protein
MRMKSLHRRGYSLSALEDRAPRRHLRVITSMSHTECPRDRAISQPPFTMSPRAEYRLACPRGSPQNGRRSIRSIRTVPPRVIANCFTGMQVFPENNLFGCSARLHVSPTPQRSFREARPRGDLPEPCPTLMKRRVILIADRREAARTDYQRLWR